MASVRWSLNALQNLVEVVSFLSRVSEASVQAFANHAQDAIGMLEDYPYVGRTVAEYADDAVRQVMVGEYRLIYWVDGDQLTVLGLIHGSRDLRRALGSSPRDIG